MHLMSSGWSFASNDRLLIQGSREHGPEMVGIPKMPRVNPGTLLHNPDLQGILPRERRAALAELPAAELWSLEEKYDVPIDAVYGRGRCRYRAPLGGLLVLTWTHDSPEPTRFEPAQLEARPDLLELIMKSPGVFHCDRDGQHLSEKSSLDPRDYIARLRAIPVVEASGKADFAQAVDHCRTWLQGGP
jgi:HprK-related kinase B